MEPAPEIDDAFSSLIEKLKSQENAVVETIVDTYAVHCNNPPTEGDGAEGLPEERLAEAVRLLVMEDFDPLTFEPTRGLLEVLSMARAETTAAEQRITFKKANLRKIEAEIEMYKQKTSAINEAMKDFLSQDNSQIVTSKERQFLNAKDTFKQMKANMAHVIKTLYPKDEKRIVQFMSNISSNYFSGNDYTEVRERIDPTLLETLQAAHLIIQHPHQERMFKLSM